MENLLDSSFSNPNLRFGARASARPRFRMEKNMGKMPHIQLSDELSVAYAVLPGDPERVARAAGFLENAKELAFHREYRSVMGTFEGMNVLFLSTGMGGPSTAIAVEELAKIGVKAAIRIGSCGALQPELNLGDLVLVSGAVRDDGASRAYVPAQYPAIPDFGLLSACRDSAREAGFSWHMGIARSHDCLYGDENPRIYEQWSRRGVMASDMETAALFVTSGLRGIRTASILNVVSRWHADVGQSVGRYADGDAAAAAGERNEILTALMALKRIEEQERREKSL